MVKARLEFVTLRRVIAFDAGTGDMLGLHVVRVEAVNGRPDCAAEAVESDIAAICRATARVYRGRMVEAVVVADDFQPRRDVTYRVDPETHRIEPRPEPRRRAAGNVRQ